MLSVHVYEKNIGPRPNICEWQRLAREHLEERLNNVHATAIPFVPLANKIIDMAKELNLTEIRWAYLDWGGLTIFVNLPDDVGFDVLFPLYEEAEKFCEDLKTLGYVQPFKVSPEPNDYEDLLRRCWTWQCGQGRFTLGAFIGANSEICKRVEIGTQPKYEFQCEGTPI